VTVADGDVADPGPILGTVSEGLDLPAPTCLSMRFLLDFYNPDTARSLVAKVTTAGLVPDSYDVISMIRGDGEVADRWFSTDGTRAGRSCRRYRPATARPSLA
jgi:hypothetical protein